MSDVTPGNVLKKYYELLEQYESQRPELVKALQKHRYWHVNKIVDLFIKWCAKQQIDDPLSYMEYRFECAHYTGYLPALDRLRINKLAEQWKNWAEGHHLEKKFSESLHEESGTVFGQYVRELKLLTKGQEAAKAPYYPNRVELCMAQHQTTGGYHPNSRFCPTCPSAVACAAELYKHHRFDVVSLRAGRLEYLPSEVVAVAR